jgi:EAL domain-containing protein (putative c-di-GMP-specific phosphodiesterase class I)
MITFEIVESEKLRSTIKVINFVKKIRLIGAKVALDDFGSGYSNYEQLRDLEVDYLKIDGSLIRDIMTDRNSEIFTKSIINVAHDLGIQTIAEFVSSEEILEKVKTLGIDYVQGYHIGKPALNLLPNSIVD